MAKSNEIYLDYAASVLPNPSSIHSSGVDAKKKLEETRKEVADILKARREEIIFTSGGTESNNLAIQGIVLAWNEKLDFSKKEIDLQKLPHIITTNIEHPSVLETFKLLEKRKLAEVSIVPVEKNGIVDVKKIKKEIKNNTVLVSVMYANNEIGTIQPIKEIAREIKYHNKENTKRKVFEWSGRDRDPENRGPEKTLPFRIFFHTDAVQAVNYLDLNVEKLGVDLLSLSGTKIEGAGRVGMLYKKKSVVLAPIFGGGDQEQGIRPGTENLPEILKFAKALKSVQKTKEKEVKRLTLLRDYFIEKLKFKEAPLLINGDLQNRLPNNVNISFPNIPSDLLVVELSGRGIMVSAKSACKSGETGGSYVIKAICKKTGAENGGVRFSMGRETTKKDIDYVVKSLSEILKKLKKWYD
jgi:cysteine desulfurase